MDIDMDFSVSFEPTKVFKQVVLASMINHKKQLVKHPCGVYFQNIPVDPITGLSAIPYKEAEELGYFKIDFLHLSVLDHFKNKQEIKRLLSIEPDWKLLLKKENVEKLFQIHQHFDLIKRIRPTSIEEIADCIALIRPGKKHLIESYINDKTLTRNTFLYTKDDEGYTFKRSHAIAYAMTIVLQLHLIQQDKL